MDIISYMLLGNLGILQGVLRLALVITLTSFGTWMFTKWQSSRFMHQRQSVYVAPQKKQPILRKGLILLISPNQKETAANAIAFHKSSIDYLWLIYSDASQENKRQLLNFFRADFTGRSNLILERHVADVNDPIEFYKIVDDILLNDLSKYNLSPGDVIADYTGMTAHASVGMAMACLKSGVNLQFVQADYKDKIPKPLAPFEIDVSHMKHNIAAHT